jgi:hypothetical protein
VKEKNSINDCVPIGTLVNDDKENEWCSMISTTLQRRGKFFVANLSHKWHKQQREV